MFLFLDHSILGRSCYPANYTSCDSCGQCWGTEKLLQQSDAEGSTTLKLDLSLDTIIIITPHFSESQKEFVMSFDSRVEGVTNMTSDVESDTRLAKRLCATKEEFGNYDVFISHRGPDTKTGFVGFLYKGLKRVGLHPFLDCISIGKGQDAWKCIDQAIKITPLALVIFSENFAQSEWCLKELHAMLGCPLVKVLPIFYNVQPWEVNFPEKGQLAAGFTKLKERNDTTLLEEWKANMQTASKLHGWEHKVGDKRLEKDLVLEVVAKIF